MNDRMYIAGTQEWQDNMDYCMEQEHNSWVEEQEELWFSTGQYEEDWMLEIECL